MKFWLVAKYESRTGRTGAAVIRTRNCPDRLATARGVVVGGPISAGSDLADNTPKPQRTPKAQRSGAAERNDALLHIQFLAAGGLPGLATGLAEAGFASPPFSVLLPVLAGAAESLRAASLYFSLR